jgi:hypothetical protein
VALVAPLEECAHALLTGYQVAYSTLAASPHSADETFAASIMLHFARSFWALLSGRPSPNKLESSAM